MGYKVKKIYVGTEKVGPDKMPGYQEVEYIQSSGTQYINTGYTPIGNNCKVISKMTTLTGNEEWSVFFGMTNNSSGYSLHYYHGKSGSTRAKDWYMNLGSSINIDTGKLFVSGEVNNVELYANSGSYSLLLNSTSYSGSYNGSIYQTTRPLYIFGYNVDGTATFLSNIKLYTFKIYYNTTLVRDFVPCYRKSDNVIGLYDLANNQFYTNQGSGTFSKGPDVN